jgi:hypothetical protein
MCARRLPQHSRSYDLLLRKIGSADHEDRGALRLVPADAKKDPEGSSSVPLPRLDSNQQPSG